MSVDIALKLDTKQFQAALKQTGRYTDKQVNQLTRKWGQGWKQTEREAKRAAQASQRAWDGALNQIGGRFSGLARSIGSLGGGGLAAGALGAAAAGVGAFGAATWAASQKMSAFVDEVVLLADGTGLAERTVLALRRAMAGAGSDIGRIQGGLAEFTRRVADAATKGGEAKATFDMYGIAVRDAAGNLRSADDVFADALATIDSFDSATDRAAARLQLFGNEAGKAMAALSPETMADAAAGVADLAEAIEQAKGASKRLDDATARLSTSWDNLTTRAGTVWAPVWASLLDTVSATLEGMSDPGGQRQGYRKLMEQADASANNRFAALGFAPIMGTPGMPESGGSVAGPGKGKGKGGAGATKTDPVADYFARMSAEQAKLTEMRRQDLAVTVEQKMALADELDNEERLVDAYTLRRDAKAQEARESAAAHAAEMRRHEERVQALEQEAQRVADIARQHRRAAAQEGLGLASQVLGKVGGQGIGGLVGQIGGLALGAGAMGPVGLALGIGGALFGALANRPQEMRYEHRGFGAFYADFARGQAGTSGARTNRTWAGR